MPSSVTIAESLERPADLRGQRLRSFDLQHGRPVGPDLRTADSGAEGARLGHLCHRVELVVGLRRRIRVSAFPFVVRVQMSSSLSVKPPGTATRKTKRLRRGRKCAGCPRSGPPRLKLLSGPTGTSISPSELRFIYPKRKNLAPVASASHPSRRATRLAPGGGEGLRGSRPSARRREEKTPKPGCERRATKSRPSSSWRSHADPRGSGWFEGEPLRADAACYYCCCIRVAVVPASCVTATLRSPCTEDTRSCRRSASA